MENQPESSPAEGSGTKHTILAAIAALVVITLILAGGFYLMGYLKKPKVEPQPVVQPAPVVTPTPPEPEPEPVMEEKPEIKRPEAVVKEFYDWYLGYSGDPFEDGAYKTHESVTDELVKKIDNLKASLEEDFDPFLCSKAKPTSFSVDPAKVNGSSASAVVNESFFGMNVPVKVNLKLMDDAWKMITVTCLSADGERSFLDDLKNALGLTYTTTSDMDFLWSVADHKGAKKITVKAKGFKTLNASLATGAIENFFKENGYQKDSLNSGGYKKGDMVCKDSSVAKGGGKYDVEIACGELKL